MEHLIWIVIAYFILSRLLSIGKKQAEKKDRTPSYDYPSAAENDEATGRREEQISKQYREDASSLPWQIKTEAESSLEVTSSEESLPSELNTRRHDKFHDRYLPESQAYLRTERKPPKDEVSFDSELSFAPTEKRHKSFHEKYPTASKTERKKKSSLLKEVTKSLGKPDSVREAIVLAEILSPPRAKRRPGRR